MADFPAPVAFADLKVGMLVRTTGTWIGPDGHNNVTVFVGRIASIDTSAHIAKLTTGLEVWDPDTSGLILTNEQMEAFTGDPSEPPAGTVIRAADGTIRERVADPSDPTVSAWYAPNSTTPVTWGALTTAGPVQQLVGGATS